MRWYANGEQEFTFDDVLLRPMYSEVPSRKTPYTHVSQWCGETEYIVQPIIVANMVSLARSEMVAALTRDSIIVPAHRNQSINDEVITMSHTAGCTPRAATVGLIKTSQDGARLEKLLEDGLEMLFLELAYADTAAAVAEIKCIRKIFKKCLVAGNVCTPEACARLFDAGANIVKCGVGGGCVCETRIVTGCGVPQLSAVAECATTGPIIADGGIRSSGDIVKCLAAGAKFVMVGSLFAGTDEADPCRIYSGMASIEANGVQQGIIPEGITVKVPYKGPAKRVAADLLAGLRQGMTMIGANNLQQLHEKAVFQRITPASITEGYPHILNRI